MFPFLFLVVRKLVALFRNLVGAIGLFPFWLLIVHRFSVVGE